MEASRACVSPLFRNAIKVSVGRYVQSLALGLAQAVNPITTRALSTTRGWTSDPSGTMNPALDCNLANPAANGACGTFDEPCAAKPPRSDP